MHIRLQSSKGKKHTQDERSVTETQPLEIKHKETRYNIGPMLCGCYNIDPMRYNEKEKNEQKFSLKTNFIRISESLWNLCSSELIEILSEIMDMTYIPFVSFLNVKFNNEDDANFEKGIVKGLFFYLTFMWCILFEVFVSGYYYVQLRRWNRQQQISRNLNTKYQLLLLIPTAILNLLEYFFIERMTFLDGTLNTIVIINNIVTLAQGIDSLRRLLDMTIYSLREAVKSKNVDNYFFCQSCLHIV